MGSPNQARLIGIVLWFLANPEHIQKKRTARQEATKNCTISTPSDLLFSAGTPWRHRRKVPTRIRPTAHAGYPDGSLHQIATDA